MEGQAEVISSFGKACPEQLPGVAPVCCSEKNVQRRPRQPRRCPPLCAVPAAAAAQHHDGPLPHDSVQGPTNDTCYKNGTLKYQTLDLRTRAEFAQCWDIASDSWRILNDIKVWDQEGSGCWLSPSKTCAAEDTVTQPFDMCP